MANESIEAAATTINWIGYWGQTDFEGKVRGDALTWTGDDVKRFAASTGREVPVEETIDAADSPCPYTGAGVGWDVADVPTPWWVEAQSHTDGPPDDESVPRKLEGWWQVIEYVRDGQTEVGADLDEGELCFVEKLWSDRLRLFKPEVSGPFGIVPVTRVCDLQLTRKEGTHAGSRWELLRDLGEGGDDPDEIRVGQKRTLLGGEFGALKLRGMDCTVQSYVEWMDRWTVEVGIKDHKGKPQHIAVVPSQLMLPKMPRDPKPNGKVCLDLAVNGKALELCFRDESVPERNKEVAKKELKGTVKWGQDTHFGLGDGNFFLRLRYVSRVRPSGRVWSSGADSMYRYCEVRYIGSGDYGLVFRVLRMVNQSRRAPDDDEEDPHQVLDVARGADKGAIGRAYRRLARIYHPDKVPEEERETAIAHFRKIHEAYENLQADPERSSDLMVLKMQHPCTPHPSKAISVPMSFYTEAKCLTLVSQLRLPHVQKLVEIGPDNEFLVTWPYISEALQPCNECDGVNQVDRVDLIRQGWSDYSRSRRSAQKVVITMMSLIRHDVMVVDPIQNILIDRESGEPLFIDFGRGETAGSIYKTRIRTFMKKVLQLLVRSVAKSSFDVATKYTKDIENTLFAELERWQDEKTRDQKKAVALLTSSTKWQEGIEVCRDVWNTDEDNPFRKMFKDQPSVAQTGCAGRMLREPKAAEDNDSDSEEEKKPQAAEDQDDDPEGFCEADIAQLTPVQRLLRAKRKKGRRAKLAKEKPNFIVKVMETLPDGKLGLGLDDADEDHRGVLIVEVSAKSKKFGWEVSDRIIEVNGKGIDDWDDFQASWDLAKGLGKAVFGIIRLGREDIEEEEGPKEPQCLHCGSKGKHLQKCTTWKALPEGVDCVYFCTRDCQKEAWKAAKKVALPAA